MRRASNHSRAVLGILIRTEAKERAHAFAMQQLRLRLQINQVLDSCNPRQFRLEWFCSGAVDGGRVHAARVEIANLLFVRTRRGLSLHRVIENLLQVLLVFVRQLRECAPARIFRRNRIGFHPPAHRELVEVVARLASSIEIRGVESPRIWFIRCPRRREQPGAHQNYRQNTNNRKDAIRRKKSF